MKRLIDLFTSEKDEVKDEVKDENAPIEPSKSEQEHCMEKEQSPNPSEMYQECQETEKEDIATGKMAEMLNDISSELKVLREYVSNEKDELLTLLNKTEDRLQRRDADIQAFQEDYYRKSTTPFIRQFIALSDMMRRIMDEPIDERCPDKEEYWKQQFGKVIESIGYILRDFSLITYQDGAYGKEFDPQKQDVVRHIETDQPELDKKISKSINPGYIWTIPYIIKAKANGEPLPLKEYQLIFRKEQVETFTMK